MCRGSAVRPRRTGNRGRPHGRALRPVHHHRARRIDPHHRRDLRRTAVERCERRRVRSSPSWAASRCGGSISISAPSAAAGRSHRPTIQAGWRAGYTYIHILIVAGIISRRSATSWCCTPVADTPAPERSPHHRRAGALSRRQRLFKRLSAPYLPLSHLVGTRPAGAAGAGRIYVPPLVLGPRDGRSHYRRDLAMVSLRPRTAT